jgi:hypothetical protein
MTYDFRIKTFTIIVHTNVTFSVPLFVTIYGLKRTDLLIALSEKRTIFDAPGILGGEGEGSQSGDRGKAAGRGVHSPRAMTQTFPLIPPPFFLPAAPPLSYPCPFPLPSPPPLPSTPFIPLPPLPQFTLVLGYYHR